MTKVVIVEMQRQASNENHVLGLKKAALWIQKETPPSGGVSEFSFESV
jgi:hypothetical protein